MTWEAVLRHNSPSNLPLQARRWYPTSCLVPQLPLIMMVKRKAEVIVLRRSVVVRLGTAVAVVAALRIGYAIGLGIDSPPHSPNATVTAAATARSSTQPITDP